MPYVMEGIINASVPCAYGSLIANITHVVGKQSLSNPFSFPAFQLIMFRVGVFIYTPDWLWTHAEIYCLVAVVDRPLAYGYRYMQFQHVTTCHTAARLCVACVWLLLIQSGRTKTAPLKFAAKHWRVKS